MTYQCVCVGVCVGRGGGGSDLNGGEVLVELRVQGGQLVNGAVEGAVVVTHDLAEEEGGEGYVHHDALKNTHTLISWTIRHCIHSSSYEPSLHFSRPIPQFYRGESGGQGLWL